MRDRMRRVVVTGIGLRSPLGSDPSTMFDALLAGRSGVRTIDDWKQVKEMGCFVGAPLDGFDAKAIPRKFRRSMGPLATYAVVAAQDAVANAGLDDATIKGGRTAAVIGSTLGSSHADEAFWKHLFETGSAYGLKSTHFLQVMAHTAVTNVAMYLGLTGEAIATNAACASSNQAIGTALDRIRVGRADVVLAGGADELHVVAALVFDIMGGASRGFNESPSHTPRPFDRARDGIVVGEGSGILVLEEREHALARGATILAEVLGYGGTSDAVNMAHPAPDGMEAAVRIALQDAGVAPEELDYVCAHATGTIVGDAAEATALHRVVGDRTPVSSIKGNLGHTLGACGGLEAAACIEAMRRGVVPPTLNLDDPDVAPLWLPTSPVERPVRKVVSTNFAFGGVNTAVVFGCADSKGASDDA